MQRLPIFSLPSLKLACLFLQKITDNMIPGATQEAHKQTLEQTIE